MVHRPRFADFAFQLWVICYQPYASKPLSVTQDAGGFSLQKQNTILTKLIITHDIQSSVRVRRQVWYYSVTCLPLPFQGEEWLQATAWTLFGPGTYPWPLPVCETSFQLEKVSQFISCPVRILFHWDHLNLRSKEHLYFFQSIPLKLIREQK